MDTTYWIAKENRLEAAERDAFSDREHEFIYVAVGDERHFISTEYDGTTLGYVIESGALKIRRAGWDGSRALRVYGNWSWAEFRKFRTYRSDSGLDII